jgi:hypothetical protein
MDFFTVPTATFRILFVLVMLSHDRHRIVLDKDAPIPRTTQTPSAGRIVQVPEVGGLHHHDARRAA